MNELVERFGSKVAVLGFPCNQFGHQTNESSEEFMNTLRHVRPGKGFEPKIDLFSKVNVNGAQAHPIFAFLRRVLKYPEDDEGIKDSKGNGMPDTEYLVSSRDAFDGTTVVLWSPVSALSSHCSCVQLVLRCLAPSTQGTNTDSLHFCPLRVFSPHAPSVPQVSRTDVAWNFEKFLCDKDGIPVKRYSRYYPTAAIAADLELLLDGKPLSHPRQ